jgi:hypothetical protein
MGSKIMKENKGEKFYFIIIFFLSLSVLILSYFTYFIAPELKKKQKKDDFFLQEIKLGRIPAPEEEKYLLGKINSQNIQYGNEFLGGDYFLLSFDNFSEGTFLNLILEDKYRNQSLVWLFLESLKQGKNEICCFEVPKATGDYKLKFVKGGESIEYSFFVKDKLVQYKTFEILFMIKIPYPNWQLLDNEILTRLISNIYSYNLKNSEKGLSVLLAARDNRGAQFVIFQRELSGKDFDDRTPLSEILAKIEKEENQALLNFNVVDDYKIIKKEIKDKEAYQEIRNISQGISYLTLSKTFLIKNFLNKNYLISVNLTCPERLSFYYRPIAQTVFSGIKINSPPRF